jgi:hypothetical protein
MAKAAPHPPCFTHRVSCGIVGQQLLQAGHYAWLYLFKTLPPPSRKGFQANDARTQFVEAQLHGVATPAKNPFRAARAAVEVNERDLGLESAASVAFEEVGGLTECADHRFSYGLHGVLVHEFPVSMATDWLRRTVMTGIPFLFLNRDAEQMKSRSISEKARSPARNMRFCLPGKGPME